MIDYACVAQHGVTQWLQNAPDRRGAKFASDRGR